MTFFQTRVPLSLNIVNIMQPYQFGKYKTNTSTCYNNNITLGLDHKLFKKGYLKATVVHIRVTLGHLKVTIGYYFLSVNIRQTQLSFTPK